MYNSVRKPLILILFLYVFLPLVFAQPYKNNLILRVGSLNSNSYPNIKAYVTVDDLNGNTVSGISNNSWSAKVDNHYDDINISVFPFNASSEYINYNIIFSNSLVDGSGLMNVQTQAILNLVGNIAAKDKISVYTMGDQAKPVCEDVLRDNFDFSVISTLEAAYDRSRVYDSIADVLQKIAAKSDERKVLIVISDEKDYTSVLSQRQFQDILERSNVPVYSIGVRRPSESVTIKLEDMSELSGGKYYYQPMTRELSNTLLKICDYINSAYIVNFKVNGLKGDNLPHTIDISLTIRDSEGSCSKEFVAQNKFWNEEPVYDIFGDIIDGEVCLTTGIGENGIIEFFTDKGEFNRGIISFQISDGSIINGTSCLVKIKEENRNIVDLHDVEFEYEYSFNSLADTNFVLNLKDYDVRKLFNIFQNNSCAKIAVGVNNKFLNLGVVDCSNFSEALQKVYSKNSFNIQNYFEPINLETIENKNDSIVSVRLLTDNAGIDDKSFNASAWRGIERFYHDGSLKDKKYSYVLCKTQDEFLPTLRQSTDDADNLIVASGFFWADAINTVAKDNPQQRYMLIDAKSDKLPNVCNALFQEETGSYLVGVLAARQAVIEGIPNPKFGFIGGIPSGTITRFEIGFIQGVRSVLPNAEIIDYYANSFSAPELGKVQAKNFYDQGVYCIFTAAGATGSGAIAQAKEYRLKNRNVWIIGVDSDQYEDGIYNDQGDSAVLTSMLKLVENATWQVLNEVQNGKFISGVREFDLAMDCVGYSISNPRLHQAAIEHAENARQDIISGKVDVVKTYREAQRRGLAPSGLRAVDD